LFFRRSEQVNLLNGCGQNFTGSLATDLAEEDFEVVGGRKHLLEMREGICSRLITVRADFKTGVVLQKSFGGWQTVYLKNGPKGARDCKLNSMHAGPGYFATKWVRAWRVHYL
jgi:hypothetical protein